MRLPPALPHRSNASQAPRSRGALTLIDRRHQWRRRAAGRHQPDRRLLFLAAKSFRIRWRTMDCRTLPRCNRTRLRHRQKRGSSGRTPLDSSVPFPDFGHREFPQGSDAQHAGSGNADHAGKPGSLAQRQRWGSPGLRPAAQGLASLLYQWAEKSDYASPFVNDRNARSNAVVTIDINDGINASQVVAALRENGIVDTNGYRKLGRNQLRIGVFPSVEPSDVDALTRMYRLRGGTSLMQGKVLAI